MTAIISGHASDKPVLLIHGGAGTKVSKKDFAVEANKSLETVLQQTFTSLEMGSLALDACKEAVKLLEDSGNFNAGKGSVLQKDGVPRLSASAMDSTRQKFSSISLVESYAYPSVLACKLQESKNRNFDSTGSKLLLEESGLKSDSPLSNREYLRWKNRSSQSIEHSTVGAVALDMRGNLAAVTSTGGVFYSQVGRMSDVSTPAGNYCSTLVAISTTGIGEHIIDAGLAVRLETLISTGIPLPRASEELLERAKKLNQEYGWIAVDNQGYWVMAYSTEHLHAACKSKSFEKALLY